MRIGNYYEGYVLNNNGCYVDYDDYLDREDCAELLREFCRRDDQRRNGITTAFGLAALAVVVTVVLAAVTTL